MENTIKSGERILIEQNVPNKLYIMLRPKRSMAGFVYIDTPDHTAMRLFEEAGIKIKRQRTLIPTGNENLRINLIDAKKKYVPAIIDRLTELRKISLIKGWGTSNECKEVVAHVNEVVFNIQEKPRA